MGAAFAHNGAKRNRPSTSEHCLEMFKRNTKAFLRRFVTVDETWIHHYMPEMKKQSKQWTSPGEEGENGSIGRKGHVHPFFWDSQGIIFTDYLEKGRTITG